MNISPEPEEAEIILVNIDSTDYEIDADTRLALDEARAELDRGEGIPFEEVKAYWQKRLHGG